MGRGSKSMIMTGVTSSMAPVHWLLGVSNDCPKQHRSSKASRIRHIWCAVPLVSDGKILDHRTCPMRLVTSNGQKTKVVSGIIVRLF